MPPLPVFVTVDVEQDCPPFLDTWRGVEEGMPALRRLLAEEQVPATMFVTGEAARRFPRLVREVVADGHELGCHGDTHRSFAAMTPAEAAREIRASTDTLRAHADVVSFRAPYLQLPTRLLPQLCEAGYEIDSSAGRHKSLRARVERRGGVLRVPASVTSSTLRWPAAVRDRLFARLRPPVVLFVHPWEFVDLRRARLRFDCRFRTGGQALASLRSAIRLFKARGAWFGRLRDCRELLAGARGAARPARDDPRQFAGSPARRGG